MIKNLHLIGTSHIAKESLLEVKRVILNVKPEIICVELDKKRFFSLSSKAKRKISISDVRRIGLKGFLFSVVGAWVEKKLGSVVGVEPGAEMLLGIKLAKQLNSRIALIDQDIELTLKRISKTLTWREKWNFFVDILKSVFFKKSTLKELGVNEIDLSKVPPKILIRKLIGRVKIRYPNLYNVLIHERNIVMARNIAHLLQKYPDKQIVAIVGAGHEDDLLLMIQKLNL